MKLLNVLALTFENNKLKKRIEYYETLLSATEKELMQKQRQYRELLGEIELLKEKIGTLDWSLYKSNKTIQEILKTAQDNNYGNIENKIKKIIELAKFEDKTSSIK